MSIQAPTHSQAPQTGLGQNLITIASGKGGVGKTWIAVTLCHAFALAGRKALLFDGDLGLANVDIQLGLMPERDLGHVIAGGLDLHSAITQFTDPSGRKFDIIAGKSGSGSLATLGRPQLRSLKNELLMLAGGYDHVVLDLGAGLDGVVTTLAANVGKTLVVVTDEPTSLTDAYAFIKVHSMRYPGSDIRILVNMAASPKGGEKTYETLRRACEGFLKLSPPLAGIIRRDEKVRDALRHQTPILTRHPQCKAGGDIERIALKLGNRP
ncbi:MAG: MinD/ParA family protein [Sphingomonadales bacterium]